MATPLHIIEFIMSFHSKKYHLIMQVLYIKGYIFVFIDKGTNSIVGQFIY